MLVLAREVSASPGTRQQKHVHSHPLSLVYSVAVELAAPMPGPGQPVPDVLDRREVLVVGPYRLDQRLQLLREVLSVCVGLFVFSVREGIL